MLIGLWEQVAPRDAQGLHREGHRGARGQTLSIPVIAGLCRAGDLVVMGLAAAVVATALHRMADAPPPGDTVVVTLITCAIACRMFGRLKLYRRSALLDPAAEMARFAVGIIVAALAPAGTLALLHGPEPIDYVAWGPLAWCLASGAGILATRSVLAWRLQALAANDRLTQKFAVVGVTPVGWDFLRKTSADPAIRSVGVYTDGGSRGPVPAAMLVRGVLSDLVAYAQRFPLDAVVIALPDAPDRIAAVRQGLGGLAVDVFLASDTASLGSPSAATVRFGGVPVIPLVARPLRDWAGLRKTAFDRATSAILLVLAAPLMGLIALAIRWSSAGPVLFRQNREGLNGTSFEILKFRTMVHDEAADQSVQAVRGDKRVTRVGAWLRGTSLDELPQLWNVLRGDMSLVGPRPHLPTTRAGDRMFCEVVPDYAARHRVKPGLTGWAQVQGLRGETKTERQIADRVAHDLYYIENWSMGLDLRILAMTVVQELSGPRDHVY